MDSRAAPRAAFAELTAGALRTESAELGKLVALAFLAPEDIAAGWVGLSAMPT